MTKRSDFALPDGMVAESSDISCGACDFCPAVHVNLHGVDGEVFATASVPLENCEPFIAKFRSAMAKLSERHSAPARQQ